MLNHTELVELYSKGPLFLQGSGAAHNAHLLKSHFFPTTPTSFQFETDFPFMEVAAFMNSNWSLAFGIAVAYLLVVFGLQEFMKPRKPFHLQWTLFTWNILLGLLSFAGFLRLFPELWKFAGRPHGFYESICIPNFTDTYATVGTLFVLSKIPELVDTVFVVLKKKPVQAVQWYHHVVSMTGFWVCFPYFEPTSRYPFVINLAVHSVMYPYFALKSIKLQVPRGISRFITTSQFIQMLIYVGANGISAYYYLSGTRFCHRHPVSVTFMIFINGSFVWMFGKLFLNLVLKPSGVAKRSKVE